MEVQKILEYKRPEENFRLEYQEGKFYILSQCCNENNITILKAELQKSDLEKALFSLFNIKKASIETETTIFKSEMSKFSTISEEIQYRGKVSVDLKRSEGKYILYADFSA